MSATDPGSEPSAEAHAYFQAIEETFIRLRGAPLLLSPADWRVASRWHRQGIPLGLVRRALEEVFARRRERGGRGRVGSLRYCQAAVEAAWEEVEELQAPGRGWNEPPLEVAPRLAALAAALPAGLAARDALARRLTGLAEEGGAGESEAVEEALARLDRELLETAERGLDGAAREELAAAVERTLAGLARRLPAEELEPARRRLAEQHLRRRLGLPVLSLFSPEAEAS